LRGGGFEALARLAEAGHIQVLIPEPVAREFVSLPTDKASAITGLRKALADLRHALPDEFARTIEKFEGDVSTQIQEIETAAESVFRAWIERTRAEIVAPGENHAQTVLDKYFDGDSPSKHGNPEPIFQTRLSWRFWPTSRLTNRCWSQQLINAWQML